MDEIHERGLESDFTLGLLMQVIQKRRHNKGSLGRLQIILMSATIQTEKFVTYLEAQIKQDHHSKDVCLSVPVHHIPGRTYPVKELFRGGYERYIRPSPPDGLDINEFRYGGWAKAGALDYDLAV